MVRQDINKLLGKALENLIKQGFFNSADIKKMLQTDTVSVCKDQQFGDYASNAAMRLAGAAKKNPMEIAAKIKEELEKSAKAKKIFAKIEVAAPGFVNFYLTNDY